MKRHISFVQQAELNTFSSGLKKLSDSSAGVANFIKYGFLAYPTAVDYGTVGELVNVSTRMRERKTAKTLESLPDENK